MISCRNIIFKISLCFIKFAHFLAIWTIQLIIFESSLRNGFAFYDNSAFFKFSFLEQSFVKSLLIAIFFLFNQHSFSFKGRTIHLSKVKSIWCQNWLPLRFIIGRKNIRFKLVLFNVACQLLWKFGAKVQSFSLLLRKIPL